MGTDALGTTPGVQICTCGCGHASWTVVVLIQERGRSVHVSVVCRDEGQPPEEYVPQVLLVPGTDPCGVAIVNEYGIGFSPQEEYWEAKRRKDRNLGAVCRGL